MMMNMKTWLKGLTGFALMGLVTSAVSAPKYIPAGYYVDTIKIPDGIVLGVGGMEFHPDGHLFICTREGEVWRYKDDKWSLFADGLHEPLGIYIDQKTEEVWVMQRPELTKLIDKDGDNVADVYEAVNSSWGLKDNYHEYSFGLVRDNYGNFYGTLNTSLSWRGWAGSHRWDIGRVHDSKMGRSAFYRGWSFQVTLDGRFVPWSSGMRSPAGIGISPEDDIFYTDNQGDWNGTSSLHHVVKGRFHGHPSSLTDHPDYQVASASTDLKLLSDYKDHERKVAATVKRLNQISVADYEKLRTPPAIWFPHGELASSPGEPVWDTTKGKFGPFAGQVFVGDQTKSNMMRAHLEKVQGEFQGIVFDFVDPMFCGVMRNRFGPDNALWVGQTGRGWGSVGGKRFGLERIVWDGKTTPMEMHHVSLTKDGFKIAFTKPVDKKAAADAANYGIKHWGYQYRAEYGSPKVGTTEVKPSKIIVAEDGKSVNLAMDLVKNRVYEFVIQSGLTGSDSSKFTNPRGWYTLNYFR